MSDMKCPFCQQEMICGGTICHYNPDCPIHDNPVPTEILELLDRTRKALDVAVDALKELYQATHYDKNNYVGKVCSNALEQIIALEQKESAFVHNKIEFPEFNDNLLEEFDKQFFEDGQDDI